jgi:hypothetical protein
MTCFHEDLSIQIFIIAHGSLEWSTLVSILHINMCGRVYIALERVYFSRCLEFLSGEQMRITLRLRRS